jgi:hypothetical protein
MSDSDKPPLELGGADEIRHDHRNHPWGDRLPTHGLEAMPPRRFDWIPVAIALSATIVVVALAALFH